LRQRTCEVVVAEVKVTKWRQIIERVVKSDFPNKLVVGKVEACDVWKLKNRGNLSGHVFSREHHSVNVGRVNVVVAGDAMPPAHSGRGSFPVGEKVKWVIDGSFEG